MYTQLTFNGEHENPAGGGQCTSTWNFRDMYYSTNRRTHTHAQVTWRGPVPAPKKRAVTLKRLEETGNGEHNKLAPLTTPCTTTTPAHSHHFTTLPKASTWVAVNSFKPPGYPFDMFTLKRVQKKKKSARWHALNPICVWFLYFHNCVILYAWIEHIIIICWCNDWPECFRYNFFLHFFPVNAIFSALTTTTVSPERQFGLVTICSVHHK